MDTKVLKFQILNGSIARRVFIRSIVLACAISMVVLLRAPSVFHLGPFAHMNTYFDCVAHLGSRSENATTSGPGSYLFHSHFWVSMNCEKDANLTLSVVTELMGKQFLNFGGNSLCVGEEGSSVAVAAMKQLGFSSVIGVYTHRFFSLKHKRIVYELDYQDNSFDFVLSRDMDKVSVPALLVLEVERVLKPGGIGALLVSAKGNQYHPNDLIRSATPVSSLLRSSSVVHVGSIDEFNLVVFKKRSENASSFYQYSLPADCPSLTFTKPLIELMEPLVSEKPLPGYEKGISYLPKFVDVSARKRMVYIDIGVGELMNANVSGWFLPPSYPIDQKAFNVYFVHYNTSILLSYVKRPGITFVYHPGLAGNGNGNGKVTAEIDADGEDMDVDPYVGEEEFDFVSWFKETVRYADFVVLKMNAGKVELKFLSDIFDSEAICFVDELFLKCPESADEVKTTNTVTSRESCMDIYRGLRSNGVYAHQWWGD